MPPGALRRVVDDAGIQREELVVAPAIQRQVLHLALVDQSRDIGGGHIGRERGRFHLNRLADSCDGERQIDIGVLPQHQRDTPLRRVEAGLFGGNLVRPHGKQRSFISARVVGEDGANRALLRVDNPDGGLRDGAAGGIGGKAGNGGLTLRPNQRRRQGYRQHKIGRRRRKRARQRVRVMAFPRPGAGGELGNSDSIDRFRIALS